MPPTFLPREPLAATFRVGMQSAGVGLLASALQNSLQRHDKGAMGIFTRTGGTIALFAAMGAAFTYVDSSVANFRETDDAANGIAFVSSLLASCPLNYNAEEDAQRDLLLA